MRQNQKISGQDRRFPGGRAAGRRIFVWLLILILCMLSVCAAESPGGTDEFAGSSGDFAGSNGGFATLTEETFAAEDLPAEYLEPAARSGRVEKLRYTTSGDETSVKSAMVYLPAGYDEAEGPFNVLYYLHGASGEPKNYLNPEKRRTRS